MSTAEPSAIRENLARVREEIHEVSRRAGRPGEVALVAVTKTVPLEGIRAAYEAGQRLFGENRVQEALHKMEALAALQHARWRLIGHLQSNKAKSAALAFSVIESVDGFPLAAKLDSFAGRAQRQLPILVEVNVAGEASKYGVRPHDLPALVESVLCLPHVELHGLMTVAPLVPDPEETRPVFARLRELRDHVRQNLGVATCTELSMGMSADYRVAIEEGATLVRVGRAIFGERVR